ncbi:surface lipoprotein assembly modifier [Neisseria zalophi]|uniref:DUF560 domain-containing protein n=1 Tax=Neisseria zalophi TaxID=640030 RepID=A0A5J6PTP6_9NEIS|nr:surface lipoprotein assembly modifier [Neisseria zalophi]QEY26088.1 DUF560 domain-containing protein [Neisseria zalophi]
MFKKLTLTPILLSSVSFLAYGADYPEGITPNEIKQELPAVRAQQQPWIEQLTKPLEKPVETNTNQQNKINAVTNEDLLKNPELLRRLMIEALNSNNPHLLSSLTIAYRQYPHADPVLLARAEGMLARYEGDYRKAVKIYSELHESQPENTRISLDTAAILQADKQWNEADSLFAEVESVPNLPMEVRDNIRLYREQNKAENRWKVDAGGSITQDKNINDAAPRYCLPLGCIEQQPEDAVGLNYFVSVDKNAPIKGNHNLLFRGYMNGVSYYFDKKSEYDNAFGRAYLGWQYQNARSSLNILPFYQWQLAGTNEFADKPTKNHTFGLNMLAHATGVQTAFSHQITPRLQSYASAEIYQQNYREDSRALRNDGRYYSLFGSLAYRLTPQHTVFGGVGVGVFKPKNNIVGNRVNNAGNTRHSFNVGWLANWQKLGGLNSRLQVSRTNRRYRGQALNTDFEWERQFNKETTYIFSLSHPKISIGTFTPKLTWERRRTSSTHKWAERKQNRLFVEIEKNF